MRRYVKYRNFEETSAFETSVSSNALTELLSDNLLKWLLWKKRKKTYISHGVKILNVQRAYLHEMTYWGQLQAYFSFKLLALSWA